MKRHLNFGKGLQRISPVCALSQNGYGDIYIYIYDVFQGAVRQAAEARGWLAGGWRQLAYFTCDNVPPPGKYPNQLDCSGFCLTLFPLLFYQS